MALLEVKHLHTYFKTRKGTVKAVNDVSYSLEEGKTIGIVGESGSGKSVSAMSILQLLDGNGYIDSGEIIFEENDLTKIKREELYKIRGNKISVIFQEPMTSLNPVFTIRKQLAEPFIVHRGMKKKRAYKEVIRMLHAVQIPNPEEVARRIRISFRRNAPEGDDRDRACVPPENSHRRRTYHRARRHHTGADFAADERFAERERHVDHLYHARSRRDQRNGQTTSS